MKPIYTREYLPGQVALAFALLRIERSDNNPNLNWDRLLIACNYHDTHAIIEELNTATNYELHRDAVLRMEMVLAFDQEFRRLEEIPPPYQLRISPAHNGFFNLLCNWKLLSIDTSDGISSTVNDLLKKYEVQSIEDSRR